MSTFIRPLRRIRIHRQRGFNQWTAYCPCCFAEDGTGIYPHADDFPDAIDWADDHIMQKHPRQPCCTDASCPACNPWPDTYGAY